MKEILVSWVNCSVLQLREKYPNTKKSHYTESKIMVEIGNTVFFTADCNTGMEFWFRYNVTCGKMVFEDYLEIYDNSTRKTTEFTFKHLQDDLFEDFLNPTEEELFLFNNTYGWEWFLTERYMQGISEDLEEGCKDSKPWDISAVRDYFLERRK